jgi:hypothetical protein
MYLWVSYKNKEKRIFCYIIKVTEERIRIH